MEATEGGEAEVSALTLEQWHDAQTILDCVAVIEDRWPGAHSAVLAELRDMADTVTKKN